MTVANAAILVACLLPIACAGIAKSRGFGKPRREGGFDNHNPRQWLASLEGWQARANAAQQNSFEALPLFIAGVLIAERAQPALQGRIDLLALVFVAARIGYIAMYVADRPSIRSLCWTVGIGACVALFFVG
ncbi:MAG: MAPEG family protein [Burkholderiales bacterium]